MSAERSTCHTPWVIRSHVRGESQRQARFADPASARQGQHARAVEQAPKLGQFLLATDETAELGRQVVPRGVGSGSTGFGKARMRARWLGVGSEFQSGQTA